MIPTYLAPLFYFQVHRGPPPVELQPDLERRERPATPDAQVPSPGHNPLAPV